MTATIRSTTMRRHGLLAVLGVFAFAGTGLALPKLLDTTVSCDALMADGAPSGDAVVHDLGIELVSNTEDVAAETSRWVRDELAAAGGTSPQTPMIVRVHFTLGGRVHPPVSTCLRQSLTMAPAERDLESFREGSAQTATAMTANMAATRDRQIDVVARAVADEVAATDFYDVRDRLTVSPLPVWSSASSNRAAAVAGAVRFVSVLAPLVSTAGDCLQPTRSELTPDALVTDCVRFEQLARITGARTSVDFLRSAANTGPQRAAAQAMADALCAHATEDACSARQHDDSNDNDTKEEPRRG